MKKRANPKGLSFFNNMNKFKIKIFLYRKGKQLYESSKGSMGF